VFKQLQDNVDAALGSQIQTDHCRSKGRKACFFQVDAESVETGIAKTPGKDGSTAEKFKCKRTFKVSNGETTHVETPMR